MDSWEDDAIVDNRAEGVFADPDKVHELGHKGEFFSVQGPLTVPRTPQGRPVIIQAGQSGRGRQFAGKWADLIFTGNPSQAIAQEHYADQKATIAAEGRDPNSVRILPMVYVITGETESIAREKERSSSTNSSTRRPRSPCCRRSPTTTSPATASMTRSPTNSSTRSPAFAAWSRVSNGTSGIRR